MSIFGLNLNITDVLLGGSPLDADPNTQAYPSGRQPGDASRALIKREYLLKILLKSIDIMKPERALWTMSILTLLINPQKNGDFS